jgi:glucosamine--fructose-6-phosphate aminotransferase (isomerizing)
MQNQGSIVPTNSSKARGPFPHFMLKEIYEQPDAVRRVLKDHTNDHGTIHLAELPFTRDQIRSFSKITIAASGSSRHAGMVGEFMFERMAAIDVEVDFASQYCYRDPVVAPEELTVFLSQSGTTIDTNTALQVATR